MKPETQMELMDSEWSFVKFYVDDAKERYTHSLKRMADRMIATAFNSLNLSEVEGFQSLQLTFPSTELAPSEPVVLYNGRRVGWGYVEGPPPGGEWDNPRAVVMHDYSPEVAPYTVIPELAPLAFALKCAETITKNFTLASPSTLNFFVGKG